MIPVGDDNSGARATPVATWLLIAVNVFAFFFIQALGADDSAIRAYGVVPQEIASGRDVVTADRRVVDPYSGAIYVVPGLARTPVPVWLTLVFSMFLHGSLSHLLGNMLFLYIFGDNVENRLGALRFTVFYLASGALAALAQVGAAVASDSGMLAPMVGASGAISAILGAYLAMFPKNRVYILTFGFLPLAVSAWFAIGIWFFFQVSNGLFDVSGSGVAYAAHVGGFLAGWLYARLFRARPRKRPRSGTGAGVHWEILD